MEVLSRHVFADMVVTYWRQGQRVALELLPLGLPPPGPRPDLEPLIVFSTRGASASGGFAAGHSLRGGNSDEGMRFVEQRVAPGGNTVVTCFERGGVVLRHVLCHEPGSRALRCRTEVENRGAQPVVFEMLSSFSLGGVSCLEGGTLPGALRIHRLRSTWSNEGRLVSEAAEDLQLEPSWSLHGVRVERFGQVGSLPVRKFFPFVGVEDVRHGVVWAAQVAIPGSWQIELWRRSATLAVSGGLADAEFGHWSKTLAPGQSFDTPWAHLTVALAPLDETSQRLIDLIPRSPAALSGNLTPVFNEFCSTWGRPTADSVRRHLDVLRGRGIGTYVIDAGWYATEDEGWELSHGDWQVSTPLFPEGLGPVARQIRQAGMLPGLWFEIETCGPRSAAYQEAGRLLHRHGQIVTSGHRRFWDLRDPWVQEHLFDTVRRRLQEGFGYLKIDYNESMGIGCDGAESLGEGLRLQMEATKSFFHRLRQVPGLVIESCASGGHRLEPSLVALADFSSFSDAHECPEVPVLAANLHRLLPPWHLQIWAVVRQTDSVDRIIYSLASAFLGVICLSGEVDRLSPEQWEWVDQGLAFHRRISALLCRGTTARQGPPQSSYRSLVGWQAVVRVGDDDQEALVVVHRFARVEGVLDTGPLVIALPWEGTLAHHYGLAAVSCRGRRLEVFLETPFSATALVITRTSPPVHF